MRCAGVPDRSVLSSSSSSRAATPEGQLINSRRLKTPTGSWEDLLTGRRPGSRKGSASSCKIDSPGNSKLNASRSNTSGSFKLDTQTQLPRKSLSDSVGGILKLETPSSSPSRMSSPGEAAGGGKETVGNLRRDTSVRSKLQVPITLRRNSCGSVGENSGLEVPTGIILHHSRRSSMGSFTLSPPRHSRRASDGSCKMHGSPNRSPSLQHSPNRNLRREASGGPADMVRKSPLGSSKSSSGSYKQGKVPPEVPPRDVPATLKLDAPRRSPSGNFPRELSRSLKVEAQKKSPSDTFHRETSRSLKVETPSRSPSTAFQPDVRGLKLETRKSPSGSFKSPSGSFKSPSGSFKSPSGSFRSPSELFALEAPRKGSSGSFKLETPRKGSSGSFKLGTPRQSPSGSSLRGMEECTCPRRGSSESQTVMRRESQGSFKVNTEGAVLQYSPGSGQTETIGNFKIDSSTEGHLVVTQLAASPSRQPGSRPDKLRIVCPLDSKIRIELKMD
ncbi:hypothetical protein Pcinc_035500 [Petrolisthes cinctipes]|uniref:Uncharacterized protein n=1 Tax=Petrolisthes cinctipes TaxID=88211 RepID=A0AAE1BWU6_PETCI|nr:hypothetical protein Pcinc_035500 [Petrolisthes cinctipes]